MKIEAKIIKTLDELLDHLADYGLEWMEVKLPVLKSSPSVKRLTTLLINHQFDVTPEYFDEETVCINASKETGY